MSKPLTPTGVLPTQKNAMVIAFFAMILAIFALKKTSLKTLISRIFETPYGHDTESILEFSKLLNCKWLKAND
jgi:hypothetical protein